MMLRGDSGAAVAGAGLIIAAIDVVARESLLFAAVGFLIGGIDDLAVDLIYAVRRVANWRRRSASQSDAPPTNTERGMIAVFVPAWDEHAVIGAMLRHSLATFGEGDYRIYVGVYPNDRATIDAVVDVAMDNTRIRMVIGTDDGPTTKAACLNTLWGALNRDEIADGFRARAIVLHDAEDVVHPAELSIFNALIGQYAAVQLPVLPLVDRRSRLVAGHYCDEFAEGHAKQLVVRQSLGAGLPLAGVGCAIGRGALQRLADTRLGKPFDADSLTEDYELGLHIAQMGGRGIVARVPQPNGEVAVVRAFFPASLDAAVRQKARWMIGIALAGWDRTGWAQPLNFGDHWMRMRDRRAPLAVLVLVAAYLALVTTAVAAIVHRGTGVPTDYPITVPGWLLLLNGAFLLWRLAMRALFTWRAYGAVEAMWSVPRMVVSNLIAMLAARRALVQYLRMLAGVPLRWDKTAHMFPAALDGSART